MSFKEKNTKALFHKVSSSSSSLSLTSGTRLPIAQNNLDSSYTDAPFKQVRKTKTSLVESQILTILSRKQTPSETRKISKMYNKIALDKTQFRSLQEAIRNKDITTNMAARQYLLLQNRSLEKSECQPSFKKYGPVSSSYQPNNVMKKDKRSFKWNRLSRSIGSSSSHQNLRITHEE